jgi:hypothetical protein
MAASATDASSWPTKVSAMTALDKVPRYRADLPLASAMVPMRAVWRLNCSVVSADNASCRVSGSVGSSMPSPSLSRT